MADNVNIDPRLYHLDAALKREFIAAQDRIALLLKARYRESILRVGAYDTGAFYEGIDLLEPRLEGEVRVLEVESDRYRDSAVAARRPQGIGDIIERGRRPPVRYPGRYPAQLAIEDADPWIIHTLQDAARDALNNT